MAWRSGGKVLAIVESSKYHGALLTELTQVVTRVLGSADTSEQILSVLLPGHQSAETAMFNMTPLGK